MAGHNVLTLDLATLTGWAEGRLDGVPRYGIWRFKDAEAVDRVRALRNQLYARLEGPDPPREVVFEAPLFRGGHASDKSARLAFGFAWACETVCRDMGVPCFESNIATTRKAVIGRGTFKAGEAKAAVIAWCQAQGWDPPDDNAADALVLWFYTLKVRHPDWPMPRGAESMLREARVLPRDPSRRNGWMVPA